MGSLWATWGSLWGYFGSLWGHFGVTLGSLWGHFGVTLGHFGVTLGHFGVTLGPKSENVDFSLVFQCFFDVQMEGDKFKILPGVGFGTPRGGIIKDLF